VRLGAGSRGVCRGLVTRAWCGGNGPVARPLPAWRSSSFAGGRSRCLLSGVWRGGLAPHPACPGGPLPGGYQRPA
jgi:hypothetical protein